jgi:hypothetical protein
VRYGGFGHAVNGLTGLGDEARLRAQVDDATVTLADHHAAGGLADEEEALEVYVDGQVEGLLRDSLSVGARRQACVVHDDIEPTEFLHRPGDRRVDLVSVPDVHRDPQGTASHRPDLYGEVTSGVRVAQAKRHIGSGVRQRQRDGATQSARRAGHQCDLAVQVEAWECVHPIPLLGHLKAPLSRPLVK